MPDDPVIDALNPFPDHDHRGRDERVRQRAYDLWVAEGQPEGKEQEHWLRAEREVLLAEPKPSLGTPTVPGKENPDIRGADGAVQHVGIGEAAPEAAAVPKTAGAPKPARNTSRSRTANATSKVPAKRAPGLVQSTSRSVE